MGPHQCKLQDTGKQPTTPTKSTLKSEDVKLAMEKAKRVASNIWIVLHSKHCRQTNCCYVGCKETKLVLLHVKCCRAAAQNQVCHVEECNKARKLLNHHQQCRDARMSIARRQAAALASSSNIASSKVKGKSLGVSSSSVAPVEPPSCLVCSMVARYVRNVLESGPSSAPVALIEKPPTPKRTDSSLCMPPPPPRRPRSTSVPALNEVSATTSQKLVHVSGGKASAAVAEMTSRVSSEDYCPLPTSLYRQRSSSDGMLCKMSSSCETIFEEKIVEHQQDMSKSSSSASFI